MNKKQEIIKVLRTIFVGIIVVGMLIPVVIMLSSSLKTYTDITLWPPRLIPKNIQWSNYYEVLFGEQSIMKAFNNSLLISIVTSLICISVGSLAAFSVTRYTFLGKRAFLFIIIVTQMFSPVILVNPMYVIFRNLNLLNTRLALIISSTASSLPMTVWLLYSYMSAIPVDMEESAMIDGCSRLQSARKILLPLVAPGIITAGLFSFIGSWGNMIYAQSFITKSELRTISLALTDFQSLYRTSWEIQMAGSVVSIIPVFIIFILIQNHLVSGIASGGVKQ